LIYFTKIDPVSTTSSEAYYYNVTDCFEAEPLISGGENAKPKEFPHMVTK